MAEEKPEAQPAPETTDAKSEACNKMECTLNWLKVIDDWSVAGYKNKFPRMYYVVGGLVIAFILL